MGEYEPNDSRDITGKTPRNPIEPERTGTREDESRRQDDDPRRGNFSQGPGARDDLTRLQKENQRSDDFPKGVDTARGSEPAT